MAENIDYQQSDLELGSEHTSSEDDSGGECGRVPLTQEQLGKWKVTELKNWLSTKGLPKSGIKQVLINRVHRAMTYDGRTSSEDEDESETDEETIDPATIQNWDTATRENIPDVTEKDIQQFFIFSRSLLGKKKNCKRQMIKAKRLSKENFIGNLKVSKGDQEIDHVSGTCHPSMRSQVVINGKQTTHYTVYVTLCRSGRIISSKCNCKAGKSGVCSHIGGLLFSLERMKSACTSSKCTWTTPGAQNKKIQPKKVEDIKFIKPEKDSEKIQPRPCDLAFNPSNCPPGDNCAVSFLDGLMKGLAEARPSSRLYLALKEDEGQKIMLQNYRPSFQYADHVDLRSEACKNDFERFVNNLTFSEKDSEEILKSTAGQSSNRNWRELRKYVITASNFGTVCRMKISTDPTSVIRSLRYQKSLDHVGPISYGKRMEGRALKAYRDTHAKHCQALVTVERKGLKINPAFPYLGASIDGYVKCEKCGEGLVEIKCPYGSKAAKWRNSRVEECCKSARFCCEWDNGIKLKPGHAYMYQVQGQMAIYQRTWCDFFVWTRKDVQCQRIMFSSQMWGEMLHKLRNFYAYNFCAELFSSRVERKLPLFC